MSKKWFGLFLSLLLLFFSSSSLFAYSQFVTVKQVMITNQGIIVNINGQDQIFQRIAFVHVGNGIYDIDVNYNSNNIFTGKLHKMPPPQIQNNESIE